ncbi:GNAT family N-acetyltransferase [Serinibacter salmoneus]|uniref:Phosphinothricin acetyltransferase n=1 Tax=Serinibacter salmoneus TaxID=556530 RepID=A0A2A9CXI8_9MICO|nr:GNAT family N-acetyltransferase [Serinibacter salmoneus]PFG18861.1 phosphinothricin acetyltransferase [Serinibacter salmoneus]
MSGYAEYRPATTRPARTLDVDVRAADVDDVTAIVEVERAARGMAPAGFLEALRALMGRHGTILLVAVLTDLGAAGEGVIGWASARFREPEDAPNGWYVGGLAVLPDVRRRGVARLLLATLDEHRPGNAGLLRSIVNARNLASLALHRSCGFREIERGPVFLGVEFTGGEGVLLERLTA